MTRGKGKRKRERRVPSHPSKKKGKKLLGHSARDKKERGKKAVQELLGPLPPPVGLWGRGKNGSQPSLKRGGGGERCSKGEVTSVIPSDAGRRKKKKSHFRRRGGRVRPSDPFGKGDLHIEGEKEGTRRGFWKPGLFLCAAEQKIGRSVFPGPRERGPSSGQKGGKSRRQHALEV